MVQEVRVVVVVEVAGLFRLIFDQIHGLDVADLVENQVFFRVAVSWR